MRSYIRKVWESLLSKPKKKARQKARLGVELLEVRCVPSTTGPTGANNTVTTLENVPYVFQTSDFGFNDGVAGSTFRAVEITTLPTAGTLTDNGNAVAAGGVVLTTDITNHELIFTPAADSSGSPYASYTFQVEAGGGASSGNGVIDPNPKTMTIDVTFVNQAPSGTSKTISIAKNSAYTLQTSDFGFTDPNIPAKSLQAVEITSTPTAGSLTDDASGTAVTVAAGTFVPVADISSGDLVFTPAANATGSPYGSFTFQVQNNGGTANGGVNIDPTAKTMTFDVIVPNSAPSGTSNTVNTTENHAYVFQTSDFGFSDPNTPPNAFQAVKVTTLPAHGTLTDNGVNVTAGTFVSAADISSGKFAFTPASDSSGNAYASFTFQVQNNGGTLAGGVDTDPTPKTMTVNVTFVNQAPTGTSKSINVVQNTSHTFSTSDFGYIDPNSPAESLLAVEITTTPTAGALTDDASGTPVTVAAGTFVPVADITNGDLVFTPAANTLGSPYASFTFQVQNNGGTANGGVDTDPTPKTITLNAVLPTKAPTGKSNTVSTAENAPYVFQSSDFGFTDPNTPAYSLNAVDVTTLPTAGTLSDNGVAITTAGTFVSAADIANGDFVFTPATGAAAARMAHSPSRFRTMAERSAAASITDPTPKTMTVNVTAPTAAASGTVSGVAYIDANGNEKFDSGELTLPGVVITLTGTTAVQNTQVHVTATTNASGDFTFLNVLPGTYSLQSGSVPRADLRRRCQHRHHQCLQRREHCRRASPQR